MKSIPALVCLVAAGLCACNTRPSTAVGDASITSASPGLLEPARTDAGRTGEPPPPVRGEQPLEPARTDAGRIGEPPPAVTTGPDGGRPSWVPRDATLTIVPAGDRDRNFGIVPPVERTIAVDAGGVEIGIQIRPRP